MKLAELTVGKRVRFQAGTFAGRTGRVDFRLPSGRVLVRINGTLPGPHGRPVKAGQTMADPADLSPA